MSLFPIVPGSTGIVPKEPPSSSGPYQLRSYGDPILSTPARDVESPLRVPSGLISRMKEVIAEHRAVGLAAQQVGSDARVAIIDGLVTLNLRITDRSEEMVDSISEGCLSVMRDGVYFRTNVRRHEWVTVEYMDLEGEIHRRSLNEFSAKIAQHEHDHLEGRCILDGLPRQQRRQAERVVGRRFP